MFKKIGLLIAGVMVVTLYAGIILPHKAEAAEAKSLLRARVIFEVYQKYAGDGIFHPHKRWFIGEAIHRDPIGWITKRYIYHTPFVPEKANFGLQVIGWSRGMAYILRQPQAPCSPWTCFAPRKYFNVTVGMRPIWFTVTHPR